MSLTNSISIKRRFLRSINIVKDHDSTKGIEGYVVTPLAQQALDQISDGFREGVSADRAFTLTGPYGSGKSSFALFLYYLLSDSKHQAWDKLREVNKKLASSLHLSVFGPRGTELGFIVLPITSRRTSVTTLLSESLEDVPDRLKNALLQDIEGLRDCADSKTAIRLVQHAAKTVVAKGYKGLFFIFDEFGKVFEEAYYNRKNTDIFVLQELAEAASRSKDAPLLILGMLHQAFGNYVDDIHDSKTKAEFSKIEGRFQPISFVETPAAQIQLLANAFERTDPKEAATPAFRKIVNEAANDDLKLHAVAGISATDFATFAKAVYPFHPLAMIALPLLFRRFGQNERSIFTYLVSNEPLGFKAFLSTAGEHQLLRLTDLYDYLLGNHETHLSRHPQGKVFLEANDLINSKPSLSLVDREILKIVAVLTALGMQSHLKASEAMIRYAVSTPFAHTVLERLMSQSVLVYRKFNGTYAIWEGSDVDLLACGEKADRALGQSGFAMAATLKKYLHPKPVIAKRHSFRTGSLRYFDVEYVDSPDSLAETLSNSSASRAVGRILVCLAQSASVLDTFSSEAVKLTSEDTSLLFAIPKSIAELKEALREVQRLKWIEENIKELRDDRVARREIAMRLADANQRVIQQQITLLDPRPDPYGSSCQWIWHGEVKTGIASSKDVSVLLSAVCDALFKKSPQIRNEMICKREPSSQAAAARNILIKFVTHPECVQKPFFGIEGFPPERSIYDCLFRASGIHREVDGSWILSAPDRQHTAANLYPCWEKMDLAIFAATDKPLPLNELYEKLRNPPYGLLDGIHPVLLTAFYVLNRNEVTLYFEDTYLPDPQDANFELLVRRPDLFAIAGARIAGMRLKIIKRLADGLKVEPYVSPVVRHLYKWYRSLPRYAQNTNLIPKEVLEFRKSLADAKSPEKLLFVDLPQVFGLSPITEKAGDAKSYDLYFEKLNQCIGSLSVLLPNLIKEQRKLLLDVCRLPNSKDGWNTLYERACFLAPRINNSELMPFLQTIITTTGDWNKAETVMGFMVSSPMANWGTLELQKYPDLAKGKAELFLDAYAPFSKSVASLSRAEQQQVDSLSEKLQKSFPNNSVNPLVTRAALLACLAALDKETK